MSNITQKIPVDTPQTITPVPEAERDTHVLGTGLGAVAGGIAGAAGGVAVTAATGLATGALMGGPLGAAIGLVAGAVAGGVLGSEVGEALNPTVEEHFWSSAYKTEPYYDSDYSFADYKPAYLTGYEGYTRYPDKSFGEVEAHLEEDYIGNRGNSRLVWVDARSATQSAWDRRVEANRRSTT
jgi:uncharacterized protein YcfJ